MNTKRIRLEPLTNGQYTISETNPNPGGETLEAPYGAAEDIKGPYMVFSRSHVTTSGRLVWPVISLGSAKAAVMHVERGGEVGVAGSGRPNDAPVSEPDDTPTLESARREYQSEATRTSLAHLESWDIWLEGRYPELVGVGAPNASATRATAVSGIDPDAKPLVA